MAMSGTPGCIQMALFARGTRRLLFRASVLTPRSLEGYYKTSTGLVGLDVNPNARDDFIKQQKAMLEKIKIIPPEAEYHKVVKSMAEYRLKKAQEITCPQKLEAELDEGQLEELLEQGERELALIGDYAEWKYWEYDEVKAAVQEDAEEEAAAAAAAKKA